jgi:hypothetical protein
VKASVIVVSYNTRELTARCLEALFENGPASDMEVFVVDNDSGDGSAGMVAERFPRVRLIANTVNAGFAAANNQAYAQSGGEFVFLLNPDALILPGSMETCLDFMAGTPDCGMCGGRIMNPGGAMEPSARRFPTALAKLFTLSGLAAKFPRSSIFGSGDFTNADLDSPLEVDWVPGTFTCIRREMLEQIGFFDERFYLYYEETDLCLRAMRNGWKVFYLPGAAVEHEGGASGKKRTDKAFDTGGSQVMSFRMRSELLYHRKNNGVAAAAAAMLVEAGWHAMRWLAHCRPGGDHAARRRYSWLVMRHMLAAARDTQLGAKAPRVPW